MSKVVRSRRQCECGVGWSARSHGKRAEEDVAIKMAYLEALHKLEGCTTFDLRRKKDMISALEILGRAAGVNISLGKERIV